MIGLNAIKFQLVENGINTRNNRSRDCGRVELGSWEQLFDWEGAGLQILQNIKVVWLCQQGEHNVANPAVNGRVRRN